MSVAESGRALRRVVVCLLVCAADAALAQPFFLSRTLDKPESLDVSVGSAFAALGPNLVVGNANRRGLDFRNGRVDVVDPKSGARLRTTLNPTQRAEDEFGTSVAVAGSVIITGAPSTVASGVAYFLDATTGAVLRTIPRPTGTFGSFGVTVAAYGTRAVIGSRGGPVRVYDADPLSPTFGNQVLSIPDPSGVSTGFGSFVGTTTGGNIIVGAPFASSGYPGGISAGAAYLFDGTTGVLLQTFRTPQPDVNDLFGSAALDVGGGQLAISGLFDERVGPVDSGAVYLFDAATGALLRTFDNPTPVSSESYGSALALVGSHLLVGSAFDDTVGVDFGVVHVFDLATGTLEQTIPSPGILGFGFSMAPLGGGFVVSGFAADQAYIFSSDVCGNGTVGAFEQCDDNNLTDGDGCDSNCTFTGCGNRVVTTGEDCDDGNTSAGDCCAANCHFESAGAPCEDDGRACYTDLCDGAGTCRHDQLPVGTDCESDNNVCTQETCNEVGGCISAARPAGTACVDDHNACTSDVCNAFGSCTHAVVISCGPCLQCDTALGCISKVATGCEPALSHHSDLTLKSKTPDELDTLSWKWTAGTLTQSGDFGSPTTTTGYEMCVFDQDGLVTGTDVPAIGICPGQLCWRTTDDGFTYLDRSYTRGGIMRIRLKSGPAGKGKIVVKGRGPSLRLPATLALSTPLRVQLRRTDSNACWDANFSTTSRSRSDLVKARAD